MKLFILGPYYSAVVKGSSQDSPMGIREKNDIRYSLNLPKRTRNRNTTRDAAQKNDRKKNVRTSPRHSFILS